MEPVRNDTTTDRRTAVELAKRLLVDSIWRTAKIEVDGVTFPDTQEIFDGRAPEGMSVDDIVTVNNIKRAWRFLLGNIDYPVDWQYIREYNRIIGEGLVRDAGRLREYGVRIGGTGWVPEIPTVESPQERVRGILEESEGEDTAMLLFGAVTRGQWFSDGNKRTALMVANHQLIHDGIGVFSIPPEDKAQFVSMLLRYYETGDYSRLSDWLSQNAVGHVPGGLTLAQSSGAAEKTNDAVNGMGIVPGVPLDGLDGGSGLLMCYPGFLGNRRNRMSEIRIADLFAGIGGIRMGMVQALGDAAHVVYSSEWNKYSVQTYEANWHDENPVAGDITKVDEHDVPDIDLLLAGFPCQPFSIAGVSKKQSMGRPTGFEDKTQGTLFFDVARIIKAKQPKAFLLENVKNLLSHDRGRTFKTIYSVLTEDLGYHVTYKLIDAAGFVPQHRERTYIVGFREENGFTFDDVKPIAHGNVGSILLPASQVPDKYVLSDKLWTYLQNYKKKHEAAGNGFGYGMVDAATDHTRTLSARYGKDGSEILVSRGEGKNPRRLTPRECARLMGYPDSFSIPVSDTQAYRQFGNSVAVPVIRAIGEAMKPYLSD